MPAQLVIADPDQEYIRQFEEELIRKFDSRAQIQIITSPTYLANYFRVHRVIDILVIAREFYDTFVKEHDIGHMIVLDREITFEEDDETEKTVLQKFTTKEELFAFIEEGLKDAPLLQPEKPKLKEKVPKVISVYSPIGGSGKSLVAYALAKKMKKLEETVVVIGCDDLQSIGIYLENRQHADEALAASLKSPNGDTYWEVLKNISQEEAPCLLPFEKPLSVLGLGTDQILKLIRLLKEKGDFGNIILDLGTDMGELNRALIQMSDVCILITEPNVVACRKLEKLVMNQDLLPVKSSITIANQMRSDGIRLNPETLFGSFAGYDNIEEAMEDPLFYRIVLEVIED